MRRINPQIDMASPHWSQISDSVIQNELNLSSINPISNRMQRSMDVIEIENQNVYVLNLIFIALIWGEIHHHLHYTKLGIKYCLILNYILVVIQLGIIQMVIIVIRLMINTCLIVILFEII